MFYLEDLAIWVKTKKAKIIRNVICGIGGLIIVGMFISAKKEGNHLKEVIEKNETTLAETDYKLNQANKKITDYETNSSVKTETARDVGDVIAEYQTQYGSISVSLNSNNIEVDKANTQISDIQEQLTAYISDGGKAVNPWYQLGDDVRSGNYAWDFLTRQATSTSVIPCVWQCTQQVTYSGTSDMKDVLSIAFADYNVETKQFSNVEVYRTYNGKNFSENGISDAMLNGIVGSLIPDECWNSEQLVEDGTMTYWTQFNILVNGDNSTDAAVADSSDASSTSSNDASVDKSNSDQSGASTDSTNESSVDAGSESSTRSNTDLLDDVLNGGN